MKKLFKIFFTYAFIFVFFTLFYLLLFRTALFSGQTVLFYRGLILLAITTGIFLFLGFVLSLKTPKLKLESIVAAVLVSASINLSSFVVLPVTFERSVTMYLLSVLKENQNNICGGLTKSKLENKLINEYIIKNKAIDKRVNEQRIIDFVKEENQCIGLNSKGLGFLKLSEIVGRLYDLKYK